MKLVTDLGNIDSLKILAAGSFRNVDLIKEIVKSDAKPQCKMQKGCLPVLVLTSGDLVFSSNCAARLLFGDSSHVEGEMLVDQWLEWESCQLRPQVYAALVKPQVETETLVKTLLKHIDDHTNSGSYILGKDLSVVDFVLWAAIFPILQDKSPLKGVVAGLTGLKGWFDRVNIESSCQDAITVVMGNTMNIWDAIKVSRQLQPAPAMPEVCTRNLRQLQVAPSSGDSDKEQTESSEPVVTEGEKSASAESFLHGKRSAPCLRKRKHPILPVNGERNVLITSALPYVNNVPHLGNIIGCVLSADVYSRYCRACNQNVLYICGTDEYGTATETKAVQEGLTPQQVCDKYNKLHTQVYKWFNIGFDYFGRTTTQEQTEIAQDIFWKLEKNGYILKDSLDQLQCQKCDRFLADRFVEGSCPFCNYEDARGDQCDKCGKLINAIELKNPRCKVCSSSPVVKTSQHLFMDLPKLEPLLVKHLDTEFDKGVWTANTRVITRSWIRDGLKPRCITRDLKWGTPVPLEGYTDKVFYVWYDAPIGYISITANYTDQWEKWWKNHEQVELYQFMAKDNVPFHSVIFPSSLLGTSDPWTVVKHLSATEYFNYEDGKFSKSRGIGVFGTDASDTGIPADIWRFYLLFVRPESQDSAFSWEDLMTKNNSELLNNIGNFINRALMFVNNNFGGEILEMDLTDQDKELLALITRELKLYLENLDKLRLRDGIRNILSISRLGNQYMQANKPWVLVKGSPEERSRSGCVCSLSANVSCLIAAMLSPYMPEVSSTIQQQLNAPVDSAVLTPHFVCHLPPGHKIGKPFPLFQKIDQCRVIELKAKYAGQQAERGAGAGKKKPAEAASPVVGPKPVASQADIDKLEQQISQQGDMVRKLKTEKAEKTQISQEVAKLLELKKQLALAQGIDPTLQASGGSKKKRGKK